ncbi:MAG: hypothetical protein PVJ76_02865 [Gemmatimonadota bacterium]|jgi:hypothetical protein
MKAVIFFSGLAGLLIFGPPFIKSRTHKHEVSVIVHEAVKTERVAYPADAAEGQVSWDDQSQCRFEAERATSVPLGSIRELQLSAGAGSLEVIGVEGLREIQAVGRACASHEEFLEDIRLTAEVDGSTLFMKTHHPEMRGWSSGNRYASLDLRVEVPAGLAAEILDGSGEMTVRDLGSAMIQDGSGEVEIYDIRGDLSVEDGSGELLIQGVAGVVRVEDGSGELVLIDAGSDVEIHDSSGEVAIRGVHGSVTLRDSSGELEIQDVTGSVRVLQDSSGDIAVRGVGGDFIVERDGSGDISHEGVQGSVDIPRKRGRM